MHRSAKLVNYIITVRSGVRRTNDVLRLTSKAKRGGFPTPQSLAAQMRFGPWRQGGRVGRVVAHQRMPVATHPNSWGGTTRRARLPGPSRCTLGVLLPSL